MRKFRFILLLPFCSFMLLASCGASKKSVVTSKKIKDTVETFVSEKNKKGDPFPNISIVTSKMQALGIGNLPKNEPILFVLFNPGCGHCSHLITQVRDSISMFKNTSILFVCGKPLLELLPAFAKQMKVDNYLNFYMGADNSDVTKQVFDYTGIPQIMMYDKDHVLQHVYYNETTIPKILNHLYPKE